MQLTDCYEHFKLLASDDVSHADENIVYEVSPDAAPTPLTEDEIKKNISQWMNDRRPADDMVVNEYTYLVHVRYDLAFVSKTIA